MSSNLTFGNINSKIATDQNIIDRTVGALIDASRVAPDDIIAVDSDVTLPTVNAVKNLVGNATAGGVTYRGTISMPATFFGTTSNNYLNNATEVETGDMFVAIGSGNLTMADGDIFVANGDALIINTSNPKNAITKAMIDDISPTYPGIEIGDYKRRAVSYSPGLGWLLCDGQAVSRSTYALLFNVIGETFGTGDGSTTFNLPNANGRVSVTAGTAAGLTNRFVGDVFGEERTTLSLNEIPVHGHTINHSHSHNHTVPDVNPGGKTSVGGPSIFGGNRDVYDSEETNTRTTSTQSLSYSGNSGNAGGGQSHNNLQPSIVDGFLFIYAGV
jgi:microcystin-dependent protein